MGMYLFTESDRHKGRAGLKDKWVSEIAGSDAFSMHFEIEKQGLLRRTLECIASNQGVPREISRLKDLVEHRASIVNEIEVNKLGEQLVLEGEAMDEDLSLDLMKGSERGGAAEEREEHGTLQAVATSNFEN
jgi:hypothetical protein